MTALSAVVAGLAVVVCGAGAAKAVRPHDTARALLGAGLPVGVAAVRAGSIVEVAVGAVALGAGGPWALAALAASYAGFAVFVTWALRTGASLSSCGCFGEPDTPPTASHASICAAAAGLTAAAALGGAGSPVAAIVRGGAAAPGGALLAVTVAAALYLTLTGLPRLAAARRTIR